MASPAGVGRIETLLMQKNFDAERVKLGPERHKVFQAAAQAIRPCGAVSSLPVQPHARIPLLALYLSAASLTCSCARRTQTSAICSRAA